MLHGVEVHPGWVLIEGDILVPKDGVGTETPFYTSLWTNGIVPYEFDSNVDAQKQAVMLESMAVAISLRIDNSSTAWRRRSFSAWRRSGTSFPGFITSCLRIYDPGVLPCVLGGGTVNGADGGIRPSICWARPSLGWASSQSRPANSMRAWSLARMAN